MYGLELAYSTPYTHSEHGADELSHSKVKSATENSEKGGTSMYYSAFV